MQAKLDADRLAGGFMMMRVVDESSVLGDVALVAAPNWTAVLFFASLATLHFSFAAISFLHGRWEAYLSVVMGTMFAAISLGVRRYRYVVEVKPAQRLVFVRSGLGRWRVTRRVRFSEVNAIRLTLLSGQHDGEARIELLCHDHNDIDCPLTEVPRQQALYLAVALGIPLQRVSTDKEDARTEAALAKANQP